MYIYINDIYLYVYIYIIKGSMLHIFKSTAHVVAAPKVTCLLFGCQVSSSSGSAV